jgi:quinol monooxygenase YgiN
MACLLEISFQLLPGKRREFSQSITMLTGGEAKGGRTSVVYEDRDDPNHLLWVEEWAERGMLERHLETDVFKTLIGALRTLAAVQDVRIVDLGLTQRSGQLPGYRPRQLEGRRISDGPEDEAQGESPRDLLK